MNIGLELSETELDLLRDHCERVGISCAGLDDHNLVYVFLNSVIGREYAKQASESEGYTV